MRPEDARALIGPDLILGLSITELADLDRSDLSVVDYLGVGPIFETGTKPDAAQPMGTEGLAALRRRTPLPIVAIGGIKAENAAEVVIAGADGISVVSAICAAPDPQAASANLAGIVRSAMRG
jgi:thiamine-phosphate pyrophosphorylase